MEIHAPITPKNLELLVKDNVVSLPGAAEAAIIEDIEKEESDIKNEITIKGRFLSAYMDRRTIKTVFNYNGRIEAAIRAIYGVCVPIPLVEFGEDSGSEGTIEFQASYKNLNILPYTFDDTKVKVNGSYCKTFEYAGRLCASFNYSGNGQMEVSVEQKANGILPGTILSVLAVLCLVAIPISQRYNEKKRRCAEGNNKNA